MSGAVLLPLYNDANFAGKYNPFIKAYDLDNHALKLFEFGYNFQYITASITEDVITILPSILNTPGDAVWFKDYANNVANKWIESLIYQNISSNVNNNFTFKGNFSSNTYVSGYEMRAFIIAFNSNWVLIDTAYSQPNMLGNFNISLDTTNNANVAHVQWGFVTTGNPVSGYNNLQFAGKQGSVTITSYQDMVCFKEDSQILTDNGYKHVQDLRKGDMIKTLLNGFVPINMIGFREVHHSASQERNKDQLFVCSKEQYPEIFEDLVITGGHSILVNEFKDNQKNKVVELYEQVYVTDGKYRLPAFVDERATIYEKEGLHKIYHIALDNDNYYMNYGIYANGLLVETCSKRYLKELSNMTLLE